MAGGQAAGGAQEYAAAVELSPDDPQLRLDHARALVESGQKPAAKAALEELLKRAGDHPAAQELLKSLNQ